MQTHERRFWGLVFVPSFKYILRVLGDLLLAIMFTTVPMMPFKTEAGQPILPSKGEGRSEHTPSWCTHGDNESLSFYMLRVLVAGHLVQEAAILYRTVFGGLELGRQWASVVQLFAVASSEYVEIDQVGSKVMRKHFWGA
jgi:hypothetical protein